MITLSMWLNQSESKRVRKKSNVNTATKTDNVPVNVNYACLCSHTCKQIFAHTNAQMKRDKDIHTDSHRYRRIHTDTHAHRLTQIQIHKCRSTHKHTLTDRGYIVCRSVGPSVEPVSQAWGEWLSKWMVVIIEAWLQNADTHQTA